MKKKIKRVYNYIFKHDGFFSYFLYLLIICVAVKYIFFPVLSITMSVNEPLAAVISGSMEHNTSFDKWYDTR